MAASDIHAEPDGVFKAGAWAILTLGGGSAGVDQFLGCGHARAVSTDKGCSDLFGRPFGEKARGEDAIFLVDFHRFKQRGDQTFAIVAGNVLSGRRGDPFGIDPCAAQHHFHALAAGIGDEEDRCALLARASRPSGPVLERFGVARQFHMDHQRERRQIDAARGNVCRNANAHAAVAQGLHRLVAFVLAMLARQRDNGKAALGQAGMQVADIIAGCAEQQRRGRFVEAQQIDDRILDIVGGNGDGLIADITMAAIFADGRDAQGIALVAFGERDNRLGHRRGEHEGPPGLRRRVEDFLKVFAKPHVEHLVGFVENGDGEAVEDKRAAFEMVAQPSGRPDDDMRALA